MYQVPEYYTDSDGFDNMVLLDLSGFPNSMVLVDIVAGHCEAGRDLDAVLGSGGLEDGVAGVVADVADAVDVVDVVDVHFPKDEAVEDDEEVDPAAAGGEDDALIQ